MPKSCQSPFVATLAALALLAGVSAYAGQQAAKPALHRVEAKKVCMINNQLFEKDLIPVAVNGKTYYGCCEMCKERLTKNPGARRAFDPVSGKEVDKATAVIAALPDGKVLYFESEKTLEQYGKGQKK